MSFARRSVGVTVERVHAETISGTNEVWHGSARVIVKAEDATTNDGLTVNEFIATRIGMALGVPVPMGDAATWEGRRAYVSAQVDLDGQSLPPADPATVVREMSAEAAKILVFDVLIHNGDRHEENLLHHPRVGLWAIDHELALGGDRVRDEAALKSLQGSPTYIPCDAFRQLEKADLDGPIKLVRALPMGAIESAAREAQVRRLLTGQQASAVSGFLRHRRDNISGLVSASMKMNGGAGWPDTTKSTPTPLPGT